MRYRTILFVSMAVFCVAAWSEGTEGDSSRLVSPELLKAGNLKILWERKLAMKPGESLGRLFILDNRIYVLSDLNFMVSLHREKGNVIFSKSVTEVGLPIVGLGLYEDELFCVLGNKLVEMSPEYGTERSMKRLKFAVLCPAVRNSSYFYVGGADRRVHALRSEDKVQVFEVAAEDDSMISAILANEDFVVFATDSGRCISFRPDKPTQLWQFAAAGGIVGPMVRDADSLFFASKDTNVYKINVLNGKFVWKYQTAAVLDEAPRVTGDVVYQRVRDEGFVAISKDNGQLLWDLSGVVDLLAEADGKAYVITKAGKLVVMDNKNAKQLYSVNFAGVSKYVSNVLDSKIYIADVSGRIACLKPIE
ncbi:MAG: PQQ-binding-like beta-propeller repeat protein [Planctomycetota bacterium]|nr:MAG: PQQ-binding-like beta-propeller repeat protein [Planctomycetota bacterium]